jgi:hypothetical protein
MLNAGFYGGSAVRELGPVSDMRTFFGCVDLAVPHLDDGGDNGLVTDRLYRRYLRLEELAPAINLISDIRAILNGMPTESVNWKSIGWNPIETHLDLSAPAASSVLHRYLKGAREIIENAMSFQKRFQIYKPVMTIISDTPRFIIDKSRPLAQYDELEGEPIWLR